MNSADCCVHVAYLQGEWQHDIWLGKLVLVFLSHVNYWGVVATFQLLQLELRASFRHRHALQVCHQEIDRWLQLLNVHVLHFFGHKLGKLALLGFGNKHNRMNVCGSQQPVVAVGESPRSIYRGLWAGNSYKPDDKLQLPPGQCRNIIASFSQNYYLVLVQLSCILHALTFHWLFYPQMYFLLWMYLNYKHSRPDLNWSLWPTATY